MPAKKYIVCLSKEERKELTKLVKTGKTSAYKRQRAQILLKADVNHSDGCLRDKNIAKYLNVGSRTIERVWHRLVEKGFQKVLERESRGRSKARCLDGDQEAHLVALSCSELPDGHSRGTLKLLAKEMVVLEYVDSICSETVRKVLKKRHQTLAT